MTIDLDAVIRLAHLTLTDDEKQTLGPQLSDILGHMAQLNQLEVDDLELPIQTMPLRGDDISPDATIDASAIAPQWELGGFYVPKIME